MITGKPIPLFKDHERFLKNLSIEAVTDCWNFKCTGKNGYGVFGIKGKSFSAHRVSWSIFKGTMDTSLVIDHKCRNRACVNPEHLRLVTKKVNNLENSISPVALNKEKTHCKRGHEFTLENTYKSKEGRGCLKCRLIYDTKRNLKISLQKKGIENG